MEELQHVAVLKVTQLKRKCLEVIPQLNSDYAKRKSLQAILSCLIENDHLVCTFLRSIYGLHGDCK